MKRLGKGWRLYPVLALGLGWIFLSRPDVRGDAEPAPLRAGFAEIDITPAVGKDFQPVYIAGFGKNRVATGVHDPILARAVVLQHGDRKIALVSVDLVGLFLSSVEKVRRELP